MGVGSKLFVCFLPSRKYYGVVDGSGDDEKWMHEKGIESMKKIKKKKGGIRVPPPRPPR
jgi:hypothetical protein